MRSTFRFIALAVMLPFSAGAQSEPLAVGARVRVTAPNDNVKASVGTIAEVRNDSIIVVNNGRSRAVARANVTRLEVSTGRRSMFLRDAGLGLGIGVVAGYVMGYATYKECNPEALFDCMFEPETRGQASALGGAIGGVLGLAAGAVVGAFHRADRWQPVSVPARVSVRPGARGITVSMSRSF